MRTDRQADRPADRQTGRQTDRYTDQQIDRQVHRHTQGQSIPSTQSRSDLIQVLVRVVHQSEDSNDELPV